MYLCIYIYTYIYIYIYKHTDIYLYVYIYVYIYIYNIYTYIHILLVCVSNAFLKVYRFIVNKDFTENIYSIQVSDEWILLYWIWICRFYIYIYIYIYVYLYIHNICGYVFILRSLSFPLGEGRSWVLNSEWKMSKLILEIGCPSYHLTSRKNQP